MNLVTYTAKASAAPIVGTAYWPGTSGVDLAAMVRRADTIAIHQVDAGDSGATVVLTPQVSDDGTNWTDGTAFANVTTAAVHVSKALTPCFARYFRLKEVVTAETAGASSYTLTFDAEPGTKVS